MSGPEVRLQARWSSDLVASLKLLDLRLVVAQTREGKVYRASGCGQNSVRGAVSQVPSARCCHAVSQVLSCCQPGAVMLSARCCQPGAVSHVTQVRTQNIWTRAGRLLDRRQRPADANRVSDRLDALCGVGAKPELIETA